MSDYSKKLELNALTSFAQTDHSLSEELKRFQVVVIKSPYEMIGDAEAQDFFMKMCQLKIAGYGKEYPEGVLPFDASDFVADHVLLCEKTETGLVPVLGFKAITLATCDHHRVNFPIFGMMKSSNDTSHHTQYFEQLVSTVRQKNEGTKLGYNGSFTVLPSKRADAFFHAHLWDFAFFLIASHYLTEGVDQVVAVCATKFKVDKQKIERGWEYISFNGLNLGPYQSTGLYEAGLIPMQIDVKLACAKDAARFPQLWDTRMVLSKANRQIKQAA